MTEQTCLVCGAPIRACSQRHVERLREVARQQEALEARTFTYTPGWVGITAP